MSRRLLMAAMAIALPLLGSCGPALAPAGLIQFEAEWEAADPERLAEVAPEAFRDAQRRLQQAQEALAARDPEAAERFAGLGVIALRTAALHLRRLELERRVRATESELEELQRERERLEDALESGRREDERSRLRKHLEQVVDEVRRQAAADDEVRDARLDPEQREALTGARLAIAAELEARALVALAALLALAEAGVLLPEQSIPLMSDIDLAAAAVAAGDLAGAQEHCEDAGVHARRMIDDAFEQPDGAGFHARLAELMAALQEREEWAGRLAEEELGIGLSLALRFTPKGRPDRGGAALVEETARLLAAVPGIGAVLVVAAHGAGPHTPASRARADGNAAVVADLLRLLLDGGKRPIPVLPVTGLGPASPLAALRVKGADRVGLLVLPLPAEHPAGP